MTARYVSTLVEAFERHTGRPALGAGPAVLSFEEALGRAGALARVLADAGVGRGDGLACVAGANRPELLLVRLAAHVLGARLTQVVAGPAEYGLEFVLRDCLPALVLHDVPVPDTGVRRMTLDETVRLAAGQEQTLPPVRAREEDIARVTYTGGTTGRPKGVASTFAAMAARNTVRPASWAEPVYLAVGSLAQRPGGRAMEQLRAGGQVEVLGSVAPREFAAACLRLGPVSTYLTTSMIYRLLDDPVTARGIPGLEVISYGDAPVHPERLHEAVTRWGGRWQQGYGLNEAAVVSRLTPADHEAAVRGGRPELLASAGRPVAGVELQVRGADGAVLPDGSTGEVWVRSAAMMTGYWNRPDLTAEVLRDGWLRTGDLGHLGADGFLYLDDRIADMVIVDGFNIYCVPVEAALTAHPGVARAAVVGRESPLTGEEVCAFLVPAAGRTPGEALAAEACDLVERALARAHRPTTVFWESELPLTGRGKPDKRRLRERAAGAVRGGPEPV
jgi:fatty-acyl-CoA synthase